MRMFITNDYKTCEGQYGYTLLCAIPNITYVFVPMVPGYYRDVHLMNRHHINDKDFISKAGSVCSKKGDIMCKLVIIPETDTDNDLLQMCKDDLLMYIYLKKTRSSHMFEALKEMGITLE